MPEVEELVVVKIKKIMPYGAFCELEEYNNREAFIHVSEVASRWIKNIHNFLKEGQRAVGRVHRIIPEKNMIDISLKRLTDADKKRKMEMYRRDRRAEKLFEIIRDKVKKPKMKLDDVVAEMERAFEDSASGLEEVAARGEEALKNTKITEEWKSVIIDVAQSSIKKQKKRLTGILIIRCNKPNAIEIIKNALISSKADISYLSAPQYMIAVEGEDFKKCDKKLKIIVDEITNEIKKAGGTCTFKEKEEQ